MTHSYAPVLRATLAATLLLATAPAARAQAPAWQTALGTSTPSGSYSTIDHTAPDNAGNLYVTGTYKGTVTVGSTTLPTSSVYGAFVARWNGATNTFAWVQPLAGTQELYVGGLAADGSTLYLAGMFSGQLTLGGQTLTSRGGRDIFAAKLTDTGAGASLMWLKQAGGTDNDNCYALARQGSALFLAGELYSINAGFDSSTASGAANGAAYAAKLVDQGTSGSFSWAQSAPATSFSVFNGVAVQGNAVYGVGTFAGDIATGAVRFHTDGASNLGAFVLKLTDQGSSAAPTWGQQVVGTRFELGSEVAAVGSNVYVAGSFSSPTVAIGSTTLTNRGLYDAFLFKLTDAGSTSSVAWVQQAGGAGNENAQALAVKGSSVYLGGYFNQAPISFGSLTLATPQGNGDLFVARLIDGGTAASYAWATRASGPGVSSTSELTLAGTRVVVAGSAQGATQFGTLSVPAASAETYGLLATLNDVAGLPTAPPAAPAALHPYPNPAHASIRVPLPAGTGPATTTLLDALGRVVHTQAATLGSAPAEATLELTGVAPGVYALRVAVGGAATTTRLVVE